MKSVTPQNEAYLSCLIRLIHKIAPNPPGAVFHVCNCRFDSRFGIGQFGMNNAESISIIASFNLDGDSIGYKKEGTPQYDACKLAVNQKAVESDAA